MAKGPAKLGKLCAALRAVMWFGEHDQPYAAGDQRQGSSLPECGHRPGVGSASEEPGKLLVVAAPVAARSLKVSALAAGAVAVACGRGWWLSGIR